MDKLQEIEFTGTFDRSSIKKVGLAIVALSISHIIATIASRITLHYIHKNTDASGNKRRIIIFSILGNAVYWIIMCITLLILPHFVGFETTAIVAVLGAVLFAIGLGLQGTLADLAAGVMLLTANTFRLNDYIEIPEINVVGTVKSFGILYTNIIDEDSGIIINVPNRKLYENAMYNYSSMQQNTVVLEFTISNKNKNIRAILETVKTRVQEIPGVLNKQNFTVTCNIAEISAMGTKIEVRLALSPEDYEVNGTRNKQTEIMTEIRAILESIDVVFVDLSSDKNQIVKQQVWS
jgi:small conductance mechanosensitive channel